MAGVSLPPDFVFRVARHPVVPQEGSDFSVYQQVSTQRAGYRLPARETIIPKGPKAHQAQQSNLTTQLGLIMSTTMKGYTALLRIRPR